MGFLEEVVGEARREVENADYGSGVAPLPSGSDSRRSFSSAILADSKDGALVVEYKRASPGQPRPNLPTRTVSEFLERTRHAGATAYSCLATRSRFDGSPFDVRDLAGLSKRPVLFKDFVVDRRQIDLAARCGAGAVLLIARLEEMGFLREPLAALAEHAHRLGLEVLLEFHARTELSRASGVGADVYGVNSRDLDSLSIDRATAEATLLEAVRRGFRPLLGLSGVEGRADAQRFWRTGVDGILVGTAVARSSDPAKFLSTLRRTEAGGSR